jgi:hypothetical protein
MFLETEVSLHKTPRMLCSVSLTNVCESDVTHVKYILRTAVRWFEQEITRRLTVL